MHCRRVRHVLGEPQPLESAHTTGEKSPAVVTEDDNVVRDIVEIKENAQDLRALGGI